MNITFFAKSPNYDLIIGSICDFPCVTRAKLINNIKSICYYENI